MPTITSAGNSTPIGQFTFALRTVRLNAETLLEILPFTPSELKALHSLGFKTTQDAIQGVLPDEYELNEGCGPTCIRYIKQKIGILAQYLNEKSDQDSQRYLAERPITELGLTSRESSVLNRLGVHTFRELVHTNLAKALEMPNCGTTTYQLLRQKQYAILQSGSDWIYDTDNIADLPISCLPLSDIDLNLLHSAGITTFGELACMNTELFRLASKPENVIHQLPKLQHFVCEKFPQACSCSENPLWTREVDDQGIAMLPFFSGKPNSGFSAESFHPTYDASRMLTGFGLFHKKAVAKFQSVGIVTLGDFLLQTPKQLAIFSSRQIERLQRQIKALLLGSTVRLDTSSFETFVRSMLSTPLSFHGNNEQKIEYTVLRLQGYTLAEIGNRFGKTRERIRQCIEKTRLLALPGFCSLRDTLTNVLNSLGGCGTLESVRLKLIETFNWNERKCTTKFVHTLLHEFFKGDFVKVAPSLYATKDFPCIKCEKIDGIIIALMGKYHGAWHTNRILEFLTKELPKHDQCASCRNGEMIPTIVIRNRLTPLWPEVRKQLVRRLDYLRKTSKKLPRHTKKYPPHIKTEAMRLILEEKYSLEQAAAQIGCSTCTIQNWKAESRKSPLPVPKKTATKQAVSRMRSQQEKTTTLKETQLSLDNFIRNYWDKGTRAIDVLLLSPEISSKVVQYVNEALKYAYEKLQ